VDMDTHFAMGERTFNVWQSRKPVEWYVPSDWWVGWGRRYRWGPGTVQGDRKVCSLAGKIEGYTFANRRTIWGNRN